MLDARTPFLSMGIKVSHRSPIECQANTLCASLLLAMFGLVTPAWAIHSDDEWSGQRHRTFTMDIVLSRGLLMPNLGDKATGLAQSQVILAQSETIHDPSCRQDPRACMPRSRPPTNNGYHGGTGSPGGYYRPPVNPSPQPMPTPIIPMPQPGTTNPGPIVGSSDRMRGAQDGMDVDFPAPTPTLSASPPPRAAQRPPPVNYGYVGKQVETVIQQGWAAKDIADQLGERVEAYTGLASAWKEELKIQAKDIFYDGFKLAIGEGLRGEMGCLHLDPNDPTTKNFQKVCDAVANSGSDILTNIKTGFSATADKLRSIVDLKGHLLEVVDGLGKQIKEFSGR